MLPHTLHFLYNYIRSHLLYELYYTVKSMELLERTFNDKKVILKNALKTHFNSIKKGLNGIFVFML